MSKKVVSLYILCYNLKYYQKNTQTLFSGTLDIDYADGEMSVDVSEDFYEDEEDEEEENDSLLYQLYFLPLEILLNVKYILKIST